MAAPTRVNTRDQAAGLIRRYVLVTLAAVAALVLALVAGNRSLVRPLLPRLAADAALILVVLVGPGLLVVRPAVQIIRRQVQERALAETRERALLEQLGHASRMNTMGELAGDLAHELNQPLGAIANYVEGCLVALEAPQPELSEVRGALEKALAVTLRAGQVLRRVRRFVTRNELEPERFEADRIVREVEELVGDEAGRRGIALRAELAPELPGVWGDPLQVQQVLLNLLRNALDAVSASVPGAQVAEKTVVIRAQRDASGGVEFAVIDRGEGIPREHLGKVFDAYFSTRAEGMGMGLAISRRIVEAHGGRLEVESEPGVRTVFWFTLPHDGGDGDDDDAGTDGLHRGR